MTENPNIDPVEEIEDEDLAAVTDEEFDEDEEFVPSPDDDVDWDNERDGSMADYADQEPDDTDVEE